MRMSKESWYTRAYRIAFPRRMTIERAAIRTVLAFAMYVGWFVAAVILVLVGYPMVAPALAISFVALPSAMLTMTGVLRRRYALDVAAWNSGVFELAQEVHRARKGEEESAWLERLRRNVLDLSRQANDLFDSPCPGLRLRSMARCTERINKAVPLETPPYLRGRTFRSDAEVQNACRGPEFRKLRRAARLLERRASTPTDI